MNKREWLVSQGLAQGTRGRFSKEADRAWGEYQVGLTRAHIEEIKILLEPDYTTPEGVRDGFDLAEPVITNPVIRKEDLAYTVDKDGRLVAHGECGRCDDRINRCACKGGPWGLRYIDKTQRPYLVVSA
jgi:hypothetical protein